MADKPSLFRHGDFMKFWVGQSISSFGSQFSPFAIQVIAVSALGATSFQLGVLSFLNTVPFLALGLLVGVYVDRHRRRQVMIFSDLGLALALFLIPLSAIFYAVTLDLLYIVTLATGVLAVFFQIAYQAYVPSLVGRSQIADANGRLQATATTAQTVGPSIAGFIIPVVTAPMACLGDSLGYLSSLVSLSTIRKPETVDTTPGAVPVVKGIREGLHVVLGDPRLRSQAACTGALNLTASGWGAIIYKYFLQDLRMSVPEVGVVLAIGGAGSVLGAVTAMRVTNWLGVGRTMVLGMVLSGATVVYYFANQATAFYSLSASLFVSSLGILWYVIPAVSYRQSLVPPEIQGRMNATMRTIVSGTLPIGSLLGGVVGEAVGVRNTVGLMTGLGALAFLIILLSPMRKIKTFPTYSEAEDGPVELGKPRALPTAPSPSSLPQFSPT